MSYRYVLTDFYIFYLKNRIWNCRGAVGQRLTAITTVLCLILCWRNKLFSFPCSGNKIQHAKCRKFGGKWRTESLNTRFPLSTLKYSVKIKQYPKFIEIEARPEKRIDLNEIYSYKSIWFLITLKIFLFLYTIVSWCLTKSL